MLISDLFAKMLSGLNSHYLWNSEVESGSSSERPNLFLHRSASYKEPIERPYFLLPWRNVSPMYKEPLRRNTYFFEEKD